KLDAARAERLVVLGDVVTAEHHVHEGADAVLVPFGSEEDHPGVARGRLQLDPSLVAHGLVGDDLEAELLGVELERNLLVLHGNADQLHLDHLGPPRMRWRRLLWGDGGYRAG